jgi:multiple sugar transport system ATP-binding protein
MAEIRVEHLHKAFGEFVAVRDSNFVVGDGEFFVMLGPSGCGKTTTLRMIAGLELPTSGRIHLGGEDVTFNRAAARDIAFVFQLFALSAHDVRQNIGFPLSAGAEPSKSGGSETRGSCASTSSTPVSRLRRRRPPARRARPLHRAPPMAFLMDEPLGTLDTEFRDIMVRELRELHLRIKATTVYVTHDQLEAMAMADKIAVMNHGIIEQFGTPQEIYDLPATMYVGDFIGSPPMNFLHFRSALKAGTRRSASTAPNSRCPRSPRIAPTPTSPSASGRSTSASHASRCAAPFSAPVSRHDAGS